MGTKLGSFRNGKFKRRDGTWVKFPKDPSSKKKNFFLLDKIGHKKYEFYCCL